jgi:phospholipid/cholesterol/gamma-HCH transport system permease protein
VPNEKARRFFSDFAEHTGEIVILMIRSVRLVFHSTFQGRLVIQHVTTDGLGSIPVVFLMSFFTGAVLTLQSFFAMQRIGTEMFTGSLVGVSLAKELIPVIGGLMLAGRVCASYSAEIGTMVVTEQVDALFTFGVNPVQYLVSPRLVALAFMAPALTLFGDFVGITGGRIVASVVCHQNPNLFDSQLYSSLEMWDIVSGMIKSFFFGLTIAIIGSHFGLRTEGGARGVGRATTTAVVVSSVIILISDFFWSKVLPFSLK